MNVTRRRYAYLAAAGAFLFSVPQLAGAQEEGFAYINNLIAMSDYVFFVLFPVAITGIVLFFFWGMAKFILSSGDDKAIADGKWQMLWSVIAIFVLVSIWGIVGALGRIFGVGQGGAISPPGVADEPAELSEQ